jgi:iron complex transport system permease protein
MTRHLLRSSLSLLLLMLAVSVIALSFGAADITGTWSAILHPFTSTDSQAHQIIWQIRAPRIATALLVGAALGVAGALAQGSTNNPLAEPAILGTAAGAGLGVLVGVLFNLVSIGSIGAVLFATVGALLTTLLVFELSHRNGTTTALQLIIVGIALSAVISAIVGLTISMVARPDARSVSFWSLGSLALVQSEDLLHLVPIIAAAIIAAFFIAKPLDLLSLGDSTAQTLGANPKRARLVAFLVLSILVATSVSTVGTIAFLGLAAPHIARFIAGPGHRKLVIASAFIGAIVLLVADTFARSIAPPNELPIGLITSLIGAPVLIFLVRSRRQVWL